LAAGVAVAAVAAFLLSQGGSHDKTSTTAAHAASDTGGPSSNAPSGWQALPPLPQPVQAAGVAAFDGMIWVVGGVRNKRHDPVTDVYAYDGHRWMTAHDKIPQLTQARAHAALVATKDSLYLIGGNGLDESATSDNARHPVVRSVLRLNGMKGQWIEDKHPLPAARESGAAAFDGNRIVFGGGNESGQGSSKSDVWARTPNGDWTSVDGSLRPARDHLAAAVDGTGTIWFVGGTDDPTAVDRFEGNTVSPAPKVVHVSNSAAVGFASGFCTIGGSFQNVRIAQSRCQPTSNSLSDLPRATAGLGAARIGDTVYVVGGHTDQTNETQFGVATALRIPSTF
jgi:hypothetical protein